MLVEWIDKAISEAIRLETKECNQHKVGTFRLGAICRMNVKEMNYRVKI